MDKGKLDKNSPVHVFESKPLRRDFGFKITAADVFNDFLYLGDDKGTRHLIQATFPSSPSKSTTQKSSLRELRNKPKISLNTASTNCSATKVSPPSLLLLTKKSLSSTLLFAKLK